MIDNASIKHIHYPRLSDFSYCHNLLQITKLCIPALAKPLAQNGEQGLSEHHAVDVDIDLVPFAGC